MLEQSFIDLFYHLRKMHYVKIFSELQKTELNLTAAEAMCVEVIFLLGSPTLKEFAEYIKISQPNATYKVSTLIGKGYVERIPSASDKREHHLKVTEKFTEYYGLNAPYIQDLVTAAYSSLSPVEIKQFEGFLERLAGKLNY